jgi:hypothetical protein
MDPPVTIGQKPSGVVTGMRKDSRSAFRKEIFTVLSGVSLALDVPEKGSQQRNNGMPVDGQKREELWRLCDGFPTRITEVTWASMEDVITTPDSCLML